MLSLEPVLLFNTTLANLFLVLTGFNLLYLIPIMFDFSIAQKVISDPNVLIT